ncbi:MAG TPA: SIMPL domain-containing protein [Methanospirillum sp.]|nr:SIMPL domain-containing protein [Methanospirillum sp.]
MQIRTWIVTILLILVILTGVSIAADSDTKTNDEKNLIHVSGSGVVKTSPDRCEISLSVVTKNSDVKAAQKENARKMDIVMGVLRDSGKGNLSSSEIGTSSYSISEVWSPDEALKAKFGEKTTIYEVSNTISIQTAQIDRIGDLIDLAVTNGANGVSSLQFTLSKQKTAEFRTQALTIAVDKARSDAEAVASSLGVTIGAVHDVTVGEPYSPSSYYNQDMRSADVSGAGPATPIEPGNIDVSAQVSIEYEIA